MRSQWHGVCWILIDVLPRTEKEILSKRPVPDINMKESCARDAWFTSVFRGKVVNQQLWFMA
jgi:hypothetical protein